MVSSLLKSSSLIWCLGLSSQAWAGTFFEYPALLTQAKHIVGHSKQTSLDIGKVLKKSQHIAKSTDRLSKTFGSMGSIKDISTASRQMKSIMGSLGMSSNFKSTSYYRATGHRPTKYDANNFSVMRNNVRKTYFMKKESYQLAGPKQIERMVKRRQLATNDAATAGIALSAEKLRSLPDMQKQLQDTMTESYKAETIRDDLRANTKMLSLVLQELLNQREVQAHMLQVTSSQVAQQQPISYEDET